MGGSTTEFGFVEEDKRYPHLAARIIEKHLDIKINSYNSVISGNDSLHSLNILLNKLIPMHPDMVILNHNINDYFTLYYEGNYWPPKSPRSKIIKRDERTNKLWEFASRQVQDSFRGITYWLGRYLPASIEQQPAMENIRATQRLTDDAYEKEFEKNLVTFVEICRIHGILPLLMTQQYRITERYGDYYDDFRKIYEKLQNVIRKVAKEKHISLIDLDIQLPKEERLIYDWVHITIEGSIYGANIVAEELIPIIRNLKH
ncbi:MAG: hypothetical protein IT292_00780 [Deltaproteobacteria bacterium]|nr:hypothetical protein [Deltaproteobacteria bacterium]